MAQLLPYLHMLWRGWWIIALTALAAFNIALFNNYNTVPMYRARAQFLVSPSPALLAGESEDLVRGIEALDKRSIVATYAEVLGSSSMYAETLADLDIDESTLRDYSRTAVVLPDASVLELTIEGSNPEMVALLANQIGERAIKFIKGLYLVYDINMLDASEVPTTPFSPLPVRDSAVAFVLGAAAGIALVFLKEMITSPLAFLQTRRLTDSQTGLYTSRYMRQLVERAIMGEERNIVALVRIINLSEHQERLPQQIWQTLLKKIADITHQELRGKDVVGHWDEKSLALLLPDLAEENAIATMTNLYKQLSRPLSLPPYANQVELDVHIGLTATLDKSTLLTLSEAVEHALDQTIEKTPPIYMRGVHTYEKAAVI